MEKIEEMLNRDIWAFERKDLNCKDGNSLEI